MITPFENILAAFILGFILGFAYFSHRIRKQLKEVLKELENVDIDVKLDIKNPVYFTELVNDVILTYDKNSYSFVTQGNTLDEIASKLYANKVKTAYLIHEKNGQKVVYLINEGKLEPSKA